MFNLISIVFKYIFIIIIYLFIFSIIRLIYLDIKNINSISQDNKAYLKLINRIESIPYNIKEYYVIDKELSLGRNDSNDIVIKDPFISKKHFLIVSDEDQCFIEDLNSSNGTFVNGDRIGDVVKLYNNDRVRIGNIEFIFVDRE